MKKLLVILFACLLLLTAVGCQEDAVDQTVDTDTDVTTTTLAPTVGEHRFENGVCTVCGATEDATTESITTTTETPTTTKTLPSTNTTSTTQRTTTTAAATFSAFDTQNWLFRVIVKEGEAQFCHTYTIVLASGDPRISESSANPYEEMVPPEYRDQEKPSFEFGGIQWYVGAGGAVPLSAIDVKGTTITLTGEDATQLVLTRTAENTVKVVSSTMELHVKAGDVFTLSK